MISSEDEFANPGSMPNPCLPPGVNSPEHLAVLESAIAKLEALDLTREEALAIAGIVSL